MSSDTAESPQLAFSEIRIEAFRRLTGVTLSNLHRLNLIVGDNNIGKTSVLEAVWLLAQGLSRETFQQLQTARAPASGPQESLAESVYSLGSINAAQRVSEVNIAASTQRPANRSLQFSLARRGIGDLKLHAPTIDRDVWRSVIQETGLFEENVDRIERLPNGELSIPCAWVGLSDHRDEASQARLIDVATRNGSKRRLVQLLRILDPDIEAISNSANHKMQLLPMLELAHIGLALPHFGDAVRRFLFLAMTITSITNGVLLVDEAEASIHWSRFPQMAKALLELLHEFNVQAFFTTHSLELIDAFVDATPDNDDIALYRLTRAPDDGRTVVTTLKEEHVRTLRFDLGRELR